MKYVVFLFTFVAFLGVSCKTNSGMSRKTNDVHMGNYFVTYVYSFKLPPGGYSIGLQPLPEKAYIAALKLYEESPARFCYYAALYLEKYHDYYIRHQRIDYSFLSPDDLETEAWNKKGNTKFFVLRLFMKETGIYPTREGWYSCQAAAWLSTRSPKIYTIAY